MNKPGSKFAETDPLLLGETYPKMNFGTLNKFRKGVMIINVNPITLLIKNRG